MKSSRCLATLAFSLLACASPPQGGDVGVDAPTMDIAREDRPVPSGDTIDDLRESDSGVDVIADDAPLALDTSASDTIEDTLAVDSADVGATDASGDAMSGPDSSADVALPPGVQLTTHAVNIVDRASAAEVVTFLTTDGTQLTAGTAAFYRYFRDEYDFLFIFSDGPAPIAPGGFVTAAAELTVNRPAIPGIGATRAINDTRYTMFSSRLKAVVGVNFNASGNGPILHETMHYWGVELASSFGFGDPPGGDSHWGFAGVRGQLGGFDPMTARCRAPAMMSPPGCTPEGSGRVQILVDRFSPIASPGDTIPYAPLELYLMGLVPQTEAGGPYLVLDDGRVVSRDSMTGRTTLEGMSLRTVTIDQIVARHGARPMAAPTDRAFRAAFVVFSETPVSAARMSALETWASIVGNDLAHPVLLSFERATGGRATMSTRLGLLR